MTKHINGYIGLYTISSDGKIFGKILGAKEITQRKRGRKGNEYMSVTLSRHNKSKHFYVHKLVAEHFLDDYDKEKEINHIDHNKFNNDISNLECVTRQENVDHAWTNSKMNSNHAKRIECHKSTIKVDSSEFENIRKLREDGLSDREIGDIYNVHKETIRVILKGNRKL